MDIAHSLPNSRGCSGHIWAKNANFELKTHFLGHFQDNKTAITYFDPLTLHQTC